MLRAGETYPERYPALLDEKCAALKKHFSSLKHPSPDIFPSSPEAYRLRAEFRIWHKDNRAYYAMMARGKEKTPHLIEHFRVGSELMQILMPPLLTIINASGTLKENLFQLEFLTSLKGEAIITLIYHRKLDDAWQEQARHLKHFLSSSLSIPELHVIGRSRGQKISIAQDFIYEQFNVNDNCYTYQQVEGSFIQPNGDINNRMLNWAHAVTQHIGGDLLELYCGNGNFTLPLSKNFSRVLATEVSKTAIQAAQHNIAINHISNIEIARLSSEEVTQAIRRVRPFNRLQHINLDSYQFSTVFVDPPRAGLDAKTLELVQSFDHICYISCNPETLIGNLHSLTQTHTIQQLAFFDQFPYTDHMECAVFLTKESCLT